MPPGRDSHLERNNNNMQMRLPRSERTEPRQRALSDTRQAGVGTSVRRELLLPHPARNASQDYEASEQNWQLPRNPEASKQAARRRPGRVRRDGRSEASWERRARLFRSGCPKHRTFAPPHTHTVRSHDGSQEEVVTTPLLSRAPAGTGSREGKAGGKFLSLAVLLCQQRTMVGGASNTRRAANWGRKGSGGARRGRAARGLEPAWAPLPPSQRAYRGEPSPPRGPPRALP